MNATHRFTFVAFTCMTLMLAASAPMAAAGPTTSHGAQSPAERASLWGGAVDGVQARLVMASRVEQDALVPVRLEIADDPDRLPAGVDRVDTFLLYTRVAVSMTNVKTGKSVVVRPPVAEGVPVENRGGDFALLDGSPVKPFAMDVALRRAGAALEPGEYDCVLSFPAAADGPRPAWVVRPDPGPGREWWSGTLATAPLRVRVLPATEKRRTLFLPRQAHLVRSASDAGFDLRCEKGDVEPVEVPVRNGLYLGTRITREGGASSLSGDALSEPDGGSLFDDPAGDHDAKAKPGDERTFTIEVFETDQPPGHAWMPGPGRDAYRTLWQHTFRVTVPPAARAAPPLQ